MGNGSDRDLIEQAANTYMFVFGAIMRSTTDEWLHIDQSTSQIKLLFTLWHQSQQTVGQIAEALGVGLPTASHLVEKLVQAGLAERVNNEVDRRQVYVHLTSAGDEMVARLREGRREQLTGWLSQMSVDDLAALLNGLQALVPIVAHDVPSEQIIRILEGQAKEVEK